MNYYKLSLACSTKNTGPGFPQIQKMSDNDDYKSTKSVYALAKHYQIFPDFVCDGDRPHLFLEFKDINLKLF